MRQDPPWGAPAARCERPHIPPEENAEVSVTDLRKGAGGHTWKEVLHSMAAAAAAALPRRTAPMSYFLGDAPPPPKRSPSRAAEGPSRLRHNEDGTVGSTEGGARPRKAQKAPRQNRLPSGPGFWGPRPPPQPRAQTSQHVLQCGRWFGRSANAAWSLTSCGAPGPGPGRQAAPRGSRLPPGGGGLEARVADIPIY